nr:MAG TPA: hypothetical protein [Caudoviricetes sp.]
MLGLLKISRPSEIFRRPLPLPPIGLEYVFCRP